MQGQGRLQAQRVPGPEPGRLHPGPEHRFPERRGDVGGHRALHSVLAGIAGAGRDARSARPTRTGSPGSGPRRPPPGETAARRARAVGPWMAIMARSLVTSLPPRASRTRAVLEALGMTSKVSASIHHTMMSSSTDPSASSRRWVYWARPGPILLRSLVSVDCRRSQAPRAAEAHRAQVAHVEGDRAVPAGQVFGDGAVGIGQRHLPAAEGHHLGAQGPVGGVERRVHGARSASGWTRPRPPEVERAQAGRRSAESVTHVSLGVSGRSSLPWLSAVTWPPGGGRSGAGAVGPPGSEAPAGAAGASAAVRCRPRSVMAVASSDTTPPSGTMLSTVWPPWSRSMISSPE